VVAFVKKLLLVVVAALGAFAITRQVKAKHAEDRLWAEATDSSTG
jgi:steroid 5-alpha reductase family enzyme